MMTLTKLAGLTDQAAERLAPLFNPPAWARVQADILTGRAELFRCPGETYAVLRVDDDELVVVAVTGRDAVPLFEVALAIAKRNGLAAVRWHTERKGLGRLLSQFGPLEVETVYRVML